MTKTVYLSLGSNLGDRRKHLEAALSGLEKLGEIRAVSSIYETEPVEFAAQPWFLNCALALATELMPKQLLKAVLDIEKKMGRRRTQSKGPRIIDIDILLFGSAVIATKGLTVPHPAMQRRRFVLEPLAEIAPDARHPGLHKTIRELREALGPQAGTVRRVPESELHS